MPRLLTARSGIGAIHHTHLSIDDFRLPIDYLFCIFLRFLRILWPVSSVIYDYLSSFFVIIRVPSWLEYPPKSAFIRVDPSAMLGTESAVFFNLNMKIAAVAMLLRNDNWIQPAIYEIQDTIDPSALLGTTVRAGTNGADRVLVDKERRLTEIYFKNARFFRLPVVYSYVVCSMS